jgi:CheY-like chemotaxis protein
MSYLAPSATPPPTVLVIDGSPELCDFLELLLADEGYAVVTTGSLAAATAAVHDQRPDLIVADGYLPDGPPFGVLDWCAAGPTTRGVPLVLCTGAVLDVEQPELAERLRVAQATVVCKPFAIETLLGVVAQHCRLPVAP